jgi:ATP-dependent helicase/nuclease subunit B
MKLSLFWLFKICSEYRLEKKCLIVPSYQVGHQLGETLAKEGGSWVNLHFAMLPALAQKVAGAELSKRGTKYISSTGSFFLVDRIFRRLKAQKKFGYFGKIEPTTGIIQALRHSISALRMAGLKSRDLRASRFINERKGEEVILLLQAYEEELGSGSLIDLPGLYELAMKKMDARRGTQEAKKQDSQQKAKRARQAERELYLAFRDRPIDALEREFIKKLAGENLVLIPQDPVHGLFRPRRMWDVASQPQAPRASPTTLPTSNIERLPWLFATTTSPPPLRDAEVGGEFEKIDKYRENIREVESLVALIKDILELLPGEDEGGKVEFAALCRGAAPPPAYGRRRRKRRIPMFSISSSG